MESVSVDGLFDQRFLSTYTPRLLLLWMLVNWVNAPASAQLTAYRVFFGITTRPPQQVILRQWHQAGQTRYLTLNPQTLETAIANLPANQVKALPWPATLQAVSQTPYGRALRMEQQRDAHLQDAGIERTDTTERGFSLTIDLCPSTKPLTRSVFEQLIGLLSRKRNPFR